MPGAAPGTITRALAFAVLLFYGAGCAPKAAVPPLALNGETASESRAPQQHDPEVVRAVRDALVREAIERRKQELAAEAARSPKPVSIDYDHPTVDHFVDHYSRRDRWVVRQSLERAAPILGMIRATLADAEVPPAIAYLPIVESKYNVEARSRAGAAGLWQFMSSTGRRYGLRVDRCVDERYDPHRSSGAAAAYLAALHEDFGDWHLALSAYNAGEGRIRRLLKKHNVSDYWTLVDRGLLPRETAHFVPKLLAIARIAEDPAKYGIEPPRTAAPLTLAKVEVDAPISLKTVAKLSEIKRGKARQLNPALRCGRVPSGGYRVRVPREKASTFKTAYANLDRQTLVYGDGIHRVRKGESPASIARLYGVSVGDLMRENGIRNPRRLRVNTRLRIPDPI